MTKPNPACWILKRATWQWHSSTHQEAGSTTCAVCWGEPQSIYAYLNVLHRPLPQRRGEKSPTASSDTTRLDWIVLNNQVQSYLKDLKEPHHPNRALHSQAAELFVVPSVSKSRTGGRAFSFHLQLQNWKTRSDFALLDPTYWNKSIPMCWNLKLAEKNLSIQHFGLLWRVVHCFS